MGMTFTRIPWTGIEARRNLLANPSGRVNNTGYVRIASHGTLTTTPGVDTRLTTTSTGRGDNTTGVIVDTLTVGTDLLPSTTYVFSVEVLGDVSGSPRSIRVNADGAGLAASASGIFSQTVLTRREIVFTTAASGDVNLSVANGQNTITGTNAIIFRDAIVELDSTFDGTYFDGATSDSALVRHDWTATANQSPSTLSTPNPATDQLTPDTRIRFPYEAGRDTRTSVMELLESEESRTVWFPPTLRRGTLTAVFSNPADAMAGMGWFAGNYDYQLAHPTAPHADMLFAIADGTISVRQNAANTELLIPFREVPS
jgi:hypothetical protein